MVDLSLSWSSAGSSKILLHPEFEYHETSCQAIYCRKRVSSSRGGVLSPAPSFGLERGRLDSWILMSSPDSTLSPEKCCCVYRPAVGEHRTSFLSANPLAPLFPSALLLCFSSTATGNERRRQSQVSSMYCSLQLLYRADQLPFSCADGACLPVPTHLPRPAASLARASSARTVPPLSLNQSGPSSRIAVLPRRWQPRGRFTQP